MTIQIILKNNTKVLDDYHFGRQERGSRRKVDEDITMISLDIIEFFLVVFGSMILGAMIFDVVRD